MKKNDKKEIEKRQEKKKTRYKEKRKNKINQKRKKKGKKEKAFPWIATSQNLPGVQARRRFFTIVHNLLREPKILCTFRNLI